MSCQLLSSSSDRQELCQITQWWTGYWWCFQLELQWLLLTCPPVLFPCLGYRHTVVTVVSLDNHKHNTSLDEPVLFHLNMLDFQSVVMDIDMLADHADQNSRQDTLLLMQLVDYIHNMASLLVKTQSLLVAQLASLTLQFLTILLEYATAVETLTGLSLLTSNLASLSVSLPCSVVFSPIWLPLRQTVVLLCCCLTSKLTTTFTLVFLVT